MMGGWTAHEKILVVVARCCGCKEPYDKYASDLRTAFPKSRVVDIYPTHRNIDYNIDEVVFRCRDLSKFEGSVQTIFVFLYGHEGCQMIWSWPELLKKYYKLATLEEGGKFHLRPGVSLDVRPRLSWFVKTESGGYIEKIINPSNPMGEPIDPI